MKTRITINTLPFIAAAILMAPSALAMQNYCHDAESEEGWQALLDSHPGDRDVRELYQLRRSLCNQIDFGGISVEEATERFEDARQRLIEKWRKNNEKQGESTSITG